MNYPFKLSVFYSGCHTFAVVVDKCNTGKLFRAPFWVAVENPTVVKVFKSRSHNFFSLFPLHSKIRIICTNDNAVVLFDAQLNAVCVTLSGNAGEVEMNGIWGPIRGHGEIHNCIW